MIKKNISMFDPEEWEEWEVWFEFEHEEKARRKEEFDIARRGGF